MNMRNELLANVIFLTMLLACIAGASFGVASYCKPDRDESRSVSNLEYRVEKMEKALQGVSVNDMNARIGTLEKEFKVIESGHNRNVDILHNHERLFDLRMETIRDLQRAVSALTDSNVQLSRRLHALESYYDAYCPKTMLCEATNNVYRLTTNDVMFVDKNGNVVAPKDIVAIDDVEASKVLKQMLDEAMPPDGVWQIGEVKNRESESGSENKENEK